MKNQLDNLLAVLRISITLMRVRIWILLVTLMRIRIRLRILPFTLTRIRIRLRILPFTLTRLRIQIKSKNLGKVLKYAHFPYILPCHLQSDADQDSAYPFDADPQHCLLDLSKFFPTLSR
jgi:hypothetical protein